MSSVWSSQAVILATTVAVSGTMALLLLCRNNKATLIENTSGNQESSANSGRVLCSCLSSGKKDGRRVKKVRFSCDVKDSSAYNDEYRKADKEVMMPKHVSYETQSLSFNDGFANKNLMMQM